MPRLSHSDAATDAPRAQMLATGKLDTRPHRSPDYAAESEALHALAHALTTSHAAMLQTLVDTALALCGAGSAGISLREREPDRPDAFRWVAVSGRCASLVNHLIPADDSPAGVVLELGSP